MMSDIQIKEELYSGKAKTIYTTNDPEVLVSHFRDSLTAFDGKKKSEAEKKGYYNAQISRKLFEMLEDEGINTHYLGMFDDERMLVEKVEIIPIEVIPRNIAAGSITRKYPFNEGDEFKEAVLVMDYKSDEYGDPMLNEDIALALGIATSEDIAKIRELALNINSILKTYMENQGLLLVDFKLEFGWANGEIVLADEISCDTCRFWDADTRESLDKDVFRFNKGNVSGTYEKLARRLVPEIFEN
ncbi:phosphoribosylaminoimidazolesuccinocarboxamide synthase [Methanohalophilus profundi]|uniref:phosphoribosylaminoimidazolesuccinocarboxamide synthase n=1 Tax=Methanohalophilus profundi TaxID=2138083 RepID=UPI00101DC3BC|nr:phosphoribosylaminoimidazolesuccinocarboxamide synthase [Methanohalophilus profundi]